MNCTHTQAVRLHIAELTELASYLDQAETNDLPETALARLGEIETELATLDSLVEQARKGLVDEINSKPPVNEEIVNCRYCKQPIQIGKGQYLEASFEKGLMGWFHYPVCKWKIEEEWKQEEKYTITINDHQVYETAYKEDALRRFYQLHKQSSGEIVLALNGHLVDSRAKLNPYQDTPEITPAPTPMLPYEISGMHSGEVWEHGRTRTKKEAKPLIERFLALPHIDYVTLSYVNRAGYPVTEKYTSFSNNKGYIMTRTIKY